MRETGISRKGSVKVSNANAAKELKRSLTVGACDELGHSNIETLLHEEQLDKIKEVDEDMVFKQNSYLVSLWHESIKL